MRRLVGAIVASSIAVPGMVAARTAERALPSRTSGAAAIEWGRCRPAYLRRAGAQCAVLQVPLDHSRPNGKKISLRLSRVRHASPDSRYQGVMLANPGGPGAPGLALALMGRSVPRRAGATYDWIGFDPRGVGSSRPRLSCLANYLHYDRPPYIPGGKRLVRIWRGRSKRYATACEKRHAALLGHMKTTDVAKDMDRIRAALGVDEINFYGYSWGSYLGQVYATLFPRRVRRMVLDSNVNPKRVWYEANLDQDRAFNRNINIWFRWVARYHKVYRLGKTAKAVRARFNRQRARLRRRPAGGVIGPSEWTDLFVLTTYARYVWTYFGSAFAGWVHDGRWRPLKAAYDFLNTPGNDNLYAVYLATQCTDAPSPQRWRTWARDNWRTYRKAPYYTWANAWFNAPCLYWRARSGEPVEVDGSNVDSLLLIGETRDAATPFNGSLVVRRLFPNSTLIAGRGGTTHGASLAGNRCIDNKVAAYLATGKRPARKAGYRADVFCPPIPAPVPSLRASAVESVTAVRPERPFPRPPFP